MSASILTSTKNALGVAEDYTPFDEQIIMHINSVFSTLRQLGLGPAEGFMIEDATPTWDAFIGDNLSYNSVKSYMYCSVRLIFDPPTTSYLITALKEQKQEFEWRLNVDREDLEWVDPNAVVDDE